MSDVILDDDDSGSLKRFVNYKLYGTPIREWHVWVACLLLGFILGKL